MTAFIKHRKKEHFNYKGACVTLWDRDDGLSLGKFIFVPKSCVKNGSTGAEEDALLTHEYGHSIQSLLLGPIYLLAVGLPSIAWNRLPYFKRIRDRKGREYDSVIFERTATDLGKRSRRQKRGE